MPARIVTGSERPPTLKTELFVLAAVTVTLAPLAVKLPEAVPLVPATTLPRFSVAGFTVNCPTPAVLPPVPESARLVTASEALLVIVAVALKAPAALGVNWTLRLELWPAARVVGRLGAVSEKYLLEIVALLIVTDALPVFEAVTVRVLLLPGATLPKLRLAFPSERLPTGFVSRRRRLHPGTQPASQGPREAASRLACFQDNF